MDNQLRAQVELLLGEAYVNLADYENGRHHLERGLSLLGLNVPSGRVRPIFGVINQAFIQGAHRLLPDTFIGRKADQRTTLLASSQACERLVEVYFTMNEVVLSLYTAFRTLNLAEDAGISPELARGYATVGALVGFVPLHGTANAYLRRALKITEYIDDMTARIWVQIVAAFYYLGVGNWAETRHLLEDALEIAESLGDHRRREDILGNLGALHYLQGNYVEATEYAEQLIEQAHQRSANFSLAIGLQGKAYNSLHSGRFADAMRSLRDLESLFSGEAKITDEALMLEMHGLFALTHLRLSEIEESLKAAERVMELIAESTPSNFSSFAGYSSPATVYLALWEDGHDLPDIEKTAWNACKSFRKYVRVFPIGKPRALLLEGLHFWLSGKHSKAQTTWQKSLAAARQMEMRFDQGLAHYQIGRHLPGGDPQRMDNLRAAAQIFNDLGAQYDLEKAENAIAGVEV